MRSQPSGPELEFYATPGRMTDLSPIAAHVASLPSEVPALCKIVQGLVVHPFWAERYGVTDTEQRDDELQIREAAGILSKAFELDDRPLDEPREPRRRVLGNCRDFTTVTTALLRDKGMPARGRCGFGRYFTEDKYVDHWVVEWWNGERWQISDAQLDDFQVRELKTSFDPLDVPADRFVDAGRGWKLYRDGEVDGDRFGVLDLWGSWFIPGNVWRDMASLNKVEMLPWDAWNLDESTPEEHIDRVAAVTAAANFDDVRALYGSNPVPEVITSFPKGEPVQVRI